jgi:hypothetical protein
MRHYAIDAHKRQTQPFSPEMRQALSAASRPLSQALHKSNIPVALARLSKA